MQPLIIHRPLKKYILLQQVGEDRAGIDVATGTKIVQRSKSGALPPGYESLYTRSGLKGHDGVDLWIVSGEEVYAATSGIVVVSQPAAENPVRGNNIELVSEDQRLFKAREAYAQVAAEFYAYSCYCHLKECLVQAGDRVDAGQLIGYADNTGTSSGDHLHFELKAVTRESGAYKIAALNGYNGCTDPSDYIADLTEEELLSIYHRVQALEESIAAG